MRSTRLYALTFGLPGVLVGALLLAGPAWSATNDVSARPHHLVLAPDAPPGRTTVTWTTGAGTFEVWASTNGGPRNLISRTSTSGRHTRSVDWIKPGYTVFALHAGRTAQPANHVPSGPLVDYTSVTTQPPPASAFGTAYWPPLETNASTLGRRWAQLKPIVAKDLDLIASMGAGVVRLVIWPAGNQLTGDPAAWRISGGPGGDEVSLDVLNRQATNLVELLQMCHERGLKANITFANTYLRRGHRAQNREFEWEWAYPPEDGGWQGFLQDALVWVNGYAKKIEADPRARSAVIAYDLENETNPAGFSYLTHIYDRSAVPRGKRGVSVLSVADHTDGLKRALGNRHLDYIEYHSYPGGSNPQVTAAYDKLVRSFPDTTVFLGEFGLAASGTCENPSLEEASQAQTVASRIMQARSRTIPYFLHWMLWDHSPPSLDQVLGLGYDPNCPKDAFGTMLSFTSHLSNPDMETVVDGRPKDWRAGAQGPGESFQFELQGRGSSDDAAATNLKYARVIVKTPPGRAWLTSQPITVKGGDGLWVNAYVRTNMREIRVGVTQLLPGGAVVRSSGPAFTPADFSWSNWLRQAGPWKGCLDRQATKAIVTVSGNARGAPGEPVEARYYLDVDAVSAATRPRPASCP